MRPDAEEVLELVGEEADKFAQLDAPVVRLLPIGAAHAAGRGRTTLRQQFTSEVGEILLGLVEDRGPALDAVIL